MGTINVDDDKYWGASTERSKKYFDIGKIFVNKTLINAIAIIKLAAAKVHKKEKQINAKICNARSVRKRAGTRLNRLTPTGKKNLRVLSGVTQY